MSSAEAIHIRLPDGSERQVAPGSTVGDVARQIGEGLARAAIAGKVNGALVDLSYPLNENSELSIVTMKSEEAPKVYRHTLAHIMAQAISRLFPGVKFAHGPTTEHGWFYDFDSGEAKLSEKDLERIEAEMRKVVNEKIPVERLEKPRPQALADATAASDHFKEHFISGMPEGASVSYYRQGDFTDLCRGPHLPNTSFAKHFKLMSVAGAYWLGDAKNQQLQRVYGVAFATKEELDAYLHQLEEARKRDHRKLGAQLDLFSFHEEGPGFPFFHPNGTTVYNLITSYWRQIHQREGYQEVKTPLILDESLWHKSGHWDNYKENMYFTAIDDRTFAVKPMNCPGHCLVYRDHLHSYRELPLRMNELGQVHRHELSGVLQGLFRVRTFVQDDAHIYCTPNQIEAEVIGVINLLQRIYKTFEFHEYHVELSTRPTKSIGSDEIWETATNALQQAMEKVGMPFKLNPGDGAFYGPKIDFHIRDSIGRTWQCGTIQLDFSMPNLLGLEYVGTDSARHTPVMIHRAILGSIERFLGILIEHHAGAFPVWLHPQQVAVLPISERFLEAARQLHQKLVGAGIRSTLDEGAEKIGYKIREAQLKKIPYMIILGEKEAEAGTITVRRRDGENVSDLSFERFVSSEFFPRPDLA